MDFWGNHGSFSGKSPFLMGKSTISTGPFSIAMLVYQRVDKYLYIIHIIHVIAYIYILT